MSGDVAYSGLPVEYGLAKQFVSSLTDAIRSHRPGSRVEFRSVPGNHDCFLPKQDIKLRETLVNGIRASLQSTPDPGILSHLLSSQEEYFNFQGFLHPLGSEPEAKVCSSEAIEFGPHRVQLCLYNSALLSQLDEQQGQLAVPMGVIDRAIRPLSPCDLSVSVFHHPYPWIEADVAIRLRSHVEALSDIVLVGHQHVGHGFSKNPLEGERIFYSEGHVLHDRTRPRASGFSVIVVDLAAKTRMELIYSWSDELYRVSSRSEPQTYSTTSRGSHVIRPTAVLLAALNDSGIGLTHRTKGVVRLDEVFVFPDADLRRSPTEHVVALKGEALERHLVEGSGSVVQGLPFGGKTALAKMVVKRWLRDGSVSQSLFPASV